MWRNARDFRVWHKCVVPADSSNVRFLGQTGRNLLELNISDSSPERTLGRNACGRLLAFPPANPSQSARF